MGEDGGDGFAAAELSAIGRRAARQNSGSAPVNSSETWLNRGSMRKSMFSWLKSVPGRAEPARAEGVPVERRYAAAERLTPSSKTFSDGSGERTRYVPDGAPAMT